VWSRIRELETLVGEARSERKMLDSLAAAISAKRAEVQEVLTQQTAKKEALLRNRANRTNPARPSEASTMEESELD
jgi:CHASE3 domain sensor protein